MTTYTLQTHLNGPSGFGQCVVRFSVTSRDVTDLNYDEDGDRECSLSEADKVEANAKLQPGQGKTLSIVVVEKLKGGVGGYSGTYATAHPVLFVSSSVTAQYVAAHELGHAPFGLPHTLNDPWNLMARSGLWEADGDDLRKDQWDAIRARADELGF